MRIKLLLAIIATLVFVQNITAQKINWEDVKIDIRNKTNLVDLYQQLEQTKKDAYKNEQYGIVAGCYNYQMLITDIKSEDSLYFKNSYFIDSILNEKQTPLLLRSTMLMLKAKRIATFKNKFFYKTNKNLFLLPPNTTDYRAMSLMQLDSLAQQYFEQANLISQQLKQTDVTNLLWLSTDQLLFLFKPDYTDIVFAEQLHHANAGVNYHYNRDNKWLSATPDEFIKSTTLPKGIDSTLRPMYNLYQRWANYHQSQPNVFYFIESLARKYFYDKNSNDNASKKVYEQYLQQLIQSPYSEVEAHGTYQLCLYWNDLGKRYSDPNGNSYYNNPSNPVNFDTAYRNYFVKAMHLFENKSQLLDSFYYLKRNLQLMETEIKTKKLSVYSPNIFLPGQQIAYHLLFKNVDTVYQKIVRLNSFDYQVANKKIYLQDLINAPAYATIATSLPTEKDYQTHAAMIRTDSLPLGYYAILYSDSTITNKNDDINFFTINITNIAVINNDSRVFVLDRTTGMPLSGAKLLVKHKPIYNKPVKDAPIKTVNKEGYVIVKEWNIDHSIVVNGADTFTVKIEAFEDEKPEDVYDKEIDDDLFSYYTDHLMLHIFTDRSIYRLGQTVYFKGILLTRDPATGERIVLSKDNIKHSILRKILKDEETGFIKGKMNLFIEDAFDETLDTLKLSVNEYGSIAGSYKLSTYAATGDWNFETDDIEIDSDNEGNFKVEEYKRPNFELSIEKPTNYLQIGDSFFVKVKVKSFAGAVLNNVKIEYDASASFTYQKKDSTGKETDIWVNKDIADTVAYTDDKGELFIKISAAFLKAYTFSNKKMTNINYTINAYAVDATGESHDKKLDISLSNRPVKIDFNPAAIYERSKNNLITVKASNAFSGNLSKQLEANIYAINKTYQYNDGQQRDTDFTFINNKWIYIGKNKTFDFESTQKGPLVYTTSFTTDSGKFKLPADILTTGNYKLEIVCKENGNIIGERSREFSIFDKENNTYPDTLQDFYYQPVIAPIKGENIKWYFGTTQKNIYSIYHAKYFAKNKKEIKAKFFYDVKHESSGVNEWNFTVPDDAIKEIHITHLYILNNKLYRKPITIYLAETAGDEPEIIVEQYRKVLVPGSKQEFVVSIKTKNENIAAELMTTMYDASLDKLEKHKWDVPDERPNYSFNTSWPDQINYNQSNTLFGRSNNMAYYSYFKKTDVQPLWWLNPLDYATSLDTSKFMTLGADVNYDYNNGGFVANMLTGKVSGISIAPGSLNEVIVVGYDNLESRKMSGSVASITIRGVSSLSSYNIPLVVIDGVIYEGDMSKIDMALITDGIIFKGADASNIYGSRASNGVIILSTKGPVQLPKMPEPQIKIRKDFSETAFFYPQVHADAKGFFNINFTMPESVTEWNWKMLAHTKHAKFIYAERKLVTQLSLMVQPNMPRFLYQGDSINLQTRISNIDTSDLTGISNCIIEDEQTGEDITSTIINKQQQNFTVGKRSNTIVAYKLKIPENLLHPLKIKITASAGNVGDGEEYTIPILSKKILVSQNQPFVINNDSVIQSPVIPADATPYGIGMYIAPKPQSAMVNALPYLAFYPYDCAEQIFNKMLANALALKLIRSDSNARQIMQQLKADNNETPQSLPDELNEQTMPWLQLNHQTQVQQQKLIKLFDTARARTMIEEYMEKLSALQNMDGGIAWFSGGKSNNYISCYLLEGFGKLKKDSLPFLQDVSTKNRFDRILPALITYCDKEFLTSSSNELFYLSARSNWLKDYPLTDALKQKTDSVLSQSWSQVNEYVLGKKALLITVSMRYKELQHIFHQNALKQLTSIRQMAIEDNINGVRWKDFSNADDFNNTAEETIAELATAFEESGTEKNTVEGIIQWLLKAKEQHNWSTTKATAAVVGLLNRSQPSVTGTPVQLTTVINDSLIDVTDDLLKGKLFNFTQLQKFPATIAIKKNDASTAVGGFNYYYFTAHLPSNEISSGVKINKQLSRLNTKGEWEPIDTNTILKVGEKINTTITINTSRQLKYVFIDEKRAAALEPADAESGYQYENNFDYYQSVRDAGYQFFATQIPSGISIISYETIVAKEGRFSTGPVSLQCMYQPGVRAYGEGVTITTTK